MPTRYGRSPWVDHFPKSRVPAYPKHRGSTPIEVVVIGGGLTGCATAYAFAAAGIKVALFEAEHIGRGASGSSTGWLGEEPGPEFLTLEKRLGLKAARHVWQSWRRAALDFAALVRRLEIKAHLDPAASIHLVGPDALIPFKREHKARRDAGLDAVLLNAKPIASETAVEAQAAIRLRDGSIVDPYRLTLGLAAAAAERGAQIFEASPVKKVTFTRKHADVHTEGGVVRTHRVVVATGVPTTLYKSLIRHFWFRSRFLVLTDPVPAKTRQRLGARTSVIVDGARPPHSIRWVEGERLLVTGADAETVPVRLLEKTLLQRTGQLMYELSTIYPDVSGVMPAYGWDTSYALTAEGIPYIGPHRNFPHHLFAFGDASHGITSAYLASRLLLRHHLGEATPLDDASFGFTR